jgi:hypothetical protein
MSLFELATVVKSTPQTNTGPQTGMIAIVGCVVVFAAMLCWMYQRDTASCAAVLGVFLAWLAVYLFSAGVWPVGLVAMLWAVAVLWMWRQSTRFVRVERLPRRRMKANNQWNEESRFGQMFGSNSVN